MQSTLTLINTMYVKDKIMLDRIKTIKSNLRSSSAINSQLIRLRSLINDEYNRQADLIEAFLVLNNYDKDIAKSLGRLINAKEETEIHNIISALSYSIPSYGIAIYPIYYLDKIKVALAGMIVKEYTRVYGARLDQKNKIVKGRSIGIDLSYIQCISLDKVEKNILEGLHFEPGHCPTKFIKVKPGAPKLRVCGRQKKVQKAVSGMQMRVVTDISKEDMLAQLMRGDDYQQAVEGKGQEHRIAMKARFERYSELYEIVQTKGLLTPLYLSVNFDYRSRMYYDLTAVFLNPQSKIGKYVWEAYAPRRLGKQDYKELAFAASSIVGRIQYEDSLEYFEANEDSIRAQLLTEEDFLERIYNKRLLKAIDDYRARTKSRFLLLLDYTTGGLIHFSTGYTRERKAMTLGNMVPNTDIQDTHQLMADEVHKIVGIDISRKDAKVINQSILAGVSLKSMTNKFNEHFGDNVIAEQQMAIIGRDVYGDTFEVFNKYSRWGKGLLDNENTSVMWKARDNVKCMSSAYIKGQEVQVYVPAITGMKSMKIYRNMPYLIESNSRTPLLVGEYTKVKDSGYLANTTHSVDATPIRDMAIELAESGEVAIFIHDNIGTIGINHNTIIRPIAQEHIKYNYDNQVFLGIQEQSSSNRKGSYIKPMDYSVNDYNEEFIPSPNFLQA